MKTLEEYKDLLTQMKVNKKGDSIAPHKAILLLSIIDLIERAEITDSFIPLSEDIIQVFGNIWKRNVPISSPFSCKFSYPFFHLQSSPFWRLIKSHDYVGQKEYSSNSSLKRDFIGAKIDDDLFQYLLNQEIRYDIRQLLHRTYLTTVSSINSHKMCLLTLISIMFLVA